MEKTINNLEKFNYQYSIEKNTIYFDLGYSLELQISFSDNEKLFISKRLTSWNFISGFVEMSLKTAFLFQFIGSLFVIFLVFSTTFNGNSIPFILLAFVLLLWTITWLLYYHVKAEIMKQAIIRWNE